MKCHGVSIYQVALGHYFSYDDSFEELYWLYCLELQPHHSVGLDDKIFHKSGCTIALMIEMEVCIYLSNIHLMVPNEDVIPRVIFVVIAGYRESYREEMRERVERIACEIEGLSN